jgi:hypothetical protein
MRPGAAALITPGVAWATKASRGVAAKNMGILVQVGAAHKTRWH